MPEISSEVLEVLLSAQAEAGRSRSSCLGSEHLLLGLLSIEQAQLSQIFQAQNIDSVRIWAAITDLSQQGGPLSPERQVSCLTSEVRQVWHRMVDEASSRWQKVAPAHLLLALVSQPEGHAYQVLQYLDLNPSELRAQALELLSSKENYPSDPESRKPVTTGFNKFTLRARLVLTRSQEEALLFQHQAIDLEHLFLGLLSAGNGVAFQVLTMSGIDLGTLEQLFMRQLCSQKSAYSGLSPRSKRVIQLAVDEAYFFRHHYLGTEHLLLGMLHESEGRKPDLLTRLGVKRKIEPQAENLFINTGLTVPKVRQWTQLVLDGGMSDDQKLSGNV